MTWISSVDLKRDFEKFKLFLRPYLLNPFENIRHLPVLHWQFTSLMVFVINFAYGLIHGLYRWDLYQFIISSLITPFLASGLLLLVSIFLYYFFQYMFEQTHDFNHIVTVLFFAYFPASLFFLGALFYPPIYLLGLLVMSVLVVRGLIENFKIPKNTVVTLVSLGFLLALVFWILDELYGYRAPVKPKSLDQLESEIDDHE